MIVSHVRVVRVQLDVQVQRVQTGTVRWQLVGERGLAWVSEWNLRYTSRGVVRCARRTVPRGWTSCCRVAPRTADCAAVRFRFRSGRRSTGSDRTCAGPPRHRVPYCTCTYSTNCARMQRKWHADWPWLEYYEQPSRQLFVHVLYKYRAPAAARPVGKVTSESCKDYRRATERSVPEKESNSVRTGSTG